MTPQELRIGNFVNKDEEVFSISYDGDIELCYDTPEKGSGFYTDTIINVKPIPLTEEWLEKFGFEMGKNPKIIQLFPMQLLETPNGFEYFLGHGFGGKFIVIKYLHQLQNLYFALTGEELTKTNKYDDRPKF